MLTTFDAPLLFVNNVKSYEGWEECCQCVGSARLEAGGRTLFRGEEVGVKSQPGCRRKNEADRQFVTVTKPERFGNRPRGGAE